MGSSHPGRLAGLLIASTVAAFKAEGGQDVAWLEWAEEWVERGAVFFLAAQVGHGHDERLDTVINAVRGVGVVWTFSIDQGEETIDSGNRLIGICTGRNLAIEYAQRDQRFHAILHIDSDITPPVDGPDRLLEVDRPIVGGHVPSYCLDGPKVEWQPDPQPDWKNWDSYHGEPKPKPGAWDGPGRISVHRDNGPWTASRRTSAPFPEGADVREHWSTAGALLVRRDVFRKIRWGWDAQDGLTDDPTYQYNARDAGFGLTWVVHSSLWHHDQLQPLEHRGHDLTVVR